MRRLAALPLLGVAYVLLWAAARLHGKRGSWAIRASRSYSVAAMRIALRRNPGQDRRGRLDRRISIR